MAMKKLKMKLVGVAPLLMHNGQLADPTNKHTKALKEISSRRKKTDADFVELMKLEWFGSLYLDDKGHVCIPADMILATVMRGAAQNKMRPKAKAGIYEAAPSFKLDYEGPKDVKQLYEDKRFVDTRGVRVGQARVMRTRPIFHRWSVVTEVMFDEDIIDKRNVVHAFEKAGMLCGIGDYLPRFGRFMVEEQS